MPASGIGVRLVWDCYTSWTHLVLWSKSSKGAHTEDTTDGSEFVCPRSGRAASALLLRLHQRTHEDEVGVRMGSFPKSSTLKWESTILCLARRSSAGSSPSDLTDSSSESGVGEVGREESSDRWSCKAVSRHVTSAFISGELSRRRIYLRSCCQHTVRRRQPE